MAHFRRWSQQVAWHSVASASGNKDSKFPDSFVNMSQLCCSSDCPPRSQMNNHMPTCKFHTHGCPFYPSIRSKPVMQAHLQLCQSGIHIRWHLHSWHRWHNLECWGRQLEGEFWGHSHGNWWSWRNCWSSRNCWWRRQDGRWGGRKSWWSRRCSNSPRRGADLTRPFLEGKPSMRHVATCHHGSPNMC